MATKFCSICGKPLDRRTRLDLRDGYLICTDCFRKAAAVKPDLLICMSSSYSFQMMKTLISSVPASSTFQQPNHMTGSNIPSLSETVPQSTSLTPSTPPPVPVVPAPYPPTNIPNYVPNNMPKQEKSEKSPFRKVLSACTTILAIIIVYLWISGKGTVVLSDFLGALNPTDSDNPYIQMIQDWRPLNGKSYGEAFHNAFDSVFWKYFKTNAGQRIVQATASYNNVKDSIIIQFLLTPINDEGTFQMEVFAAQASGKNLSKAEIAIMLSGVFGEDIINPVGDSIFFNGLK